MLSGVLRLIANHLLSSSSSEARQKSGPFPPPELPGFNGRMDLSDSRSRRRPSGGVWGGNPRVIGSPPITRVALSTCRAHYPGGSQRVHMPASFPVAYSLPRYAGGSASASLLSRPAQASLPLRPADSLGRPKATFVTGLQPADYSDKLPVSYSTKPATIEVEPSSTGNTPLRGTLRKIAPRRCARCRASRRDFAHPTIAAPRVRRVRVRQLQP